MTEHTDPARRSEIERLTHAAEMQRITANMLDTLCDQQSEIIAELRAQLFAESEKRKRLVEAIEDATVSLSLLADRLRGTDEDDAYKIRDTLDRALTPEPTVEP